MDFLLLPVEIKLGHLLNIMADDILTFFDANPDGAYPNFEFGDIAHLSTLGESLLDNRLVLSNLNKEEIDLCRRSILNFQNSDHARKREIGQDLAKFFPL